MNEAAAVLPDPEPVDDDSERVPVEVVEQHDEPTRVLDDEKQASGQAVVAYERPTPLVPGHDISIIPASGELRDLAAMAVTLAGALAVPKPLQNRPNDVFQVLLSARDLGVAVTTAMREFHVIDGRVTLSPKVKLAMVNERGAREGWAVWPDPDNNAEQATWYATRVDRPGIQFRSGYSWEMAKGAGMVSGGCFARDHESGQKCKCKSNWKAYPERMVSWRALGYLLDDVFPEVATGIYSPDELGGLTDDEGNFIDVASSEPLPGTSAPRGSTPSPADKLLVEADPDTHAALARRAEAIKTVADAHEALKELWIERDENDVPRLPPLPHLTVRQRSRADALIASIERRIKKDEWGENARDVWMAASQALAAQTALADDQSADTADDASGGSESPTASVDDETITCRHCASSITLGYDFVNQQGWIDETQSLNCGDEAGNTHEPASLSDETPAEDHAPQWSDDTELMQLCVNEAKRIKLLSDVQRRLRDEHGVEPEGNPQAQRKQLALALYLDRGGKATEAPNVPLAAHEQPPVEQPTLDES